MTESRSKQRLLIAVALFTSLSLAQAAPSAKGLEIAPINTSPAGQTYGHWAADWWQWALGIPAAANPIVDATGANCGQRQVSDVWFLAGVFGAGTVERHCHIPAGKSLFFPLANYFYGAFLNDSPETRTEEYARDNVRTNGPNCPKPDQISVVIDGVQVNHPERYFTGETGSPSPFFTVQLPPGNVFGLQSDNPDDQGTYAAELVLTPTAEQGYYLFLKPFSPGDHTIHWTVEGEGCGDQSVTYHLEIGE